MVINVLSRYWAVFSLLFFGLLTGSLQGSHMMGADMSYSCLGGGKYKIIAKVYRDCRGISFNSPTFGVYAGKDRGNGCGSYGLTISRISITDVSQLCSTAPRTCDSNKSATGNGVEMHLFEAVVDFNTTPLINYVGKSSCCEVTFYLGQCCRNGAITTGAANDDFYTTTTINICNSLSSCNSSPTFSNRPIFYACCNQPYRFNHGLIDDTPGDSVSFRLVSGLRAFPTTSVNYAAPFSYKYPVTPYCGSASITCVPDPSKRTPVGFYFDGVSGDMVFTPSKCDEVAIVVLEAIEYKKVGGVMVEMGSVKRDMQLIVENCAINMVPEIKGSDSLCVAEGDTVCFNVQAFDTLQTGQTVGDIIDLTWNSGISGATFTPVSTGKNPVSRFCWIVPKGATSSLPYTFSVKAMDDNCPRRAMAYKGFVIKVGACNSLGISSMQKINEATVFPNPVPVGQVVTVNSDEPDAIWRISTINGTMVAQGVLIDRQLEVPNNIPAGMYLLYTGPIHGLNTSNHSIQGFPRNLSAVFRLMVIE